MFGITFEQGRNELKIDDETALKYRHREQGRCPTTQKRDLTLSPDHAEIHPVQLGVLRPGRTGSSAWARASRAASTARAWRATRRTSGSCASTPRCWACRSVRTSRRPNRDNAIDVYISDECGGRAGRRRVGRDLHHTSRTAAPAEEKQEWLSKRHGRLLWAATHSSPLGTTSSARAVPA